MSKKHAGHGMVTFSHIGEGRGSLDPLLVFKPPNLSDSLQIACSSVPTVHVSEVMNYKTRVWESA